MRATYEDLIREVRRQIAVDADQAWAWLLDRSRVLNAEANWLVLDGVPLAPMDPPTAVEYGRFWGSGDETEIIWVEALWAGTGLTPTLVYQRSTPHAMDARVRGWTGNTLPIYCSAPRDSSGLVTIEVNPASDQDTLYARIVYDVVDDRTGIPPFPTDFDQALVDGAVAMGLARMDERMDSASYFDSRFATAIGRLRRRRHGRVGRGPVPIRVVM